MKGEAVEASDWLVSLFMMPCVAVRPGQPGTITCTNPLSFFEST